MKDTASMYNYPDYQCDIMHIPQFYRPLRKVLSAGTIPDQTCLRRVKMAAVAKVDEETAYQSALDYLYSFVDYSLTRAFLLTPDKFDLTRMFRLMERLGNPEKGYPILHIAGTKGKGSVSALCASGLKAAGYRVGLYTSPHLQDYAERIQINGQPIPHGVLAGLVEEIKPVVAEIPNLTTFELTTALAFLYFARQDVNAAVIEVGLGGRLDATNVVDPMVAVITTLSYDHMNVLGDTLTKIAGEKAGIIKPGRPVVSSPQKDEALQVIQQAAAEKEAPLTLVGEDILFAPIAHSLDGQSMYVWPAAEQERVNTFIETAESGGWEPFRITIPLLGYHQMENTATAYAALVVARQAGLAIDDEDIRRGFRASRLAWTV